MFRRKKPDHDSDAHIEQPLQHGLKRASFFRRAFALAIDFIVAGTVFLGGLILPLIIMDRKGWIDFPDADITFSFYGNWYSILWLVLYFALVTWLMNGRTVGKWLCGIRVVSLSGDRISFKSSLKRAFGFGLFQSLPGRTKISKHDQMVGTIVAIDPIWKRKPELPESEREGDNMKRGNHV